MSIVTHSELETFELPGLRHQTVAGPEQGTKTMEVWLQTMDPGAATPMHRHACEEVIVILRGSGVCEIQGERHPFEAGSTLIVEPDAVHQIVNTSDEEMHLVAAFGMCPVRVRESDGSAMPLPWDAPASASS